MVLLKLLGQNAKFLAFGQLPHFSISIGDDHVKIHILDALLPIKLFEDFQAAEGVLKRGRKITEMVVGLSHVVENVGDIYGEVLVLLEDFQGLLVMLQGLGAVLLAAVDVANDGEHRGEVQDFIFLLF